MKPIIGITPTAQLDTLDHGTFRRYVLSASYPRAVAEAGGTPIILPPQDDVDAFARLIDGLLLSGGADLEPSRYGDAAVHPATYGIDPERDAFEIALYHAVAQLGKPIFGICRGIQVINVALGGTLIQDIATEHPGAAEIGHRQHERGLADSELGHTVTATIPELLPIFDQNGRLGVNSFHHQAIRDLAPDLVPVCRSPDGLIEAVTHAGNAPIFAVQWHPELMFETHPEHLRPFTRLVDAAAAIKLAVV